MTRCGAALILSSTVWLGGETLLAQAPATAGSHQGDARPFASAVVAPDLASSEAEHELEPKPEVFIQTRFARGRVADAPADTSQNFQLTRLETRWAGRVSERVGVGLELQFHPALAGAAEELVNDAFVEFYASPRTTLRIGQFVKPFGFDIQQPSSAREAPERGMFAGYFFPGQRDRGVLLAWNSAAAGNSGLPASSLASVKRGITPPPYPNTPTVPPFQ